MIFKSPGECDHVWASVRDVGTTIIWDGCEADDESKEIVDYGVDCNILEDEKELKCKLYPDEKGISKQTNKLWRTYFRSKTSFLVCRTDLISNCFTVPADPANPVGKPEQQVDGGNKDICEKFDEAIISCIDGICTVYSNLYK